MKPAVNAAPGDRRLRILLTLLLLGIAACVLYPVLFSPDLGRIDLIRGDAETLSRAELPAGAAFEQSVYLYRDCDQILLSGIGDDQVCEAEAEILQDGRTLCSSRIAFGPGETQHPLAAAGERGTLTIRLVNLGPGTLSLPLVSPAEYDTDYLVSSADPLLGIRVSRSSAAVRRTLAAAVLLLLALFLPALWGWGQRWTRGKGALFILLVSVVYMALFPAWNINDFSAHFSTAYAFSSRMLGTPPVDEGNRLMVREEDEYYFRYVLTEPYTPYYQPSRRSYADAAADLFRPCGETRLIASRSALPPLDGYGFWNYIPGIAGLLAARLLSLNLVTAVFLGRLFSLAFYGAGIAFALRRLPEGLALPATAVSCLPVCTMNLTAISYDPLCYVLILIFLSCLLALREKPRPADALSLAVCSTALGMAKGGAYLPFLAAAFLLPGKKDARKWRLVLLCCLMGLMGLVVNYRLLLLGRGRYFQFGHEGWNTYNPGWFFSHPLSYFVLMIRTYLREADQILLIGRYLGWNYPVLPAAVCVLFHGLIWLSALSSRGEEAVRPFSPREKCLMLLPPALLILFTPVMMLSSTDVGSELISGMQGRYFLPLLLPLALLLFYRKNRNLSLRKADSSLLLGGIGLLSLLSVYYAAAAFLI
ncbi:MAG: DUF2142 domain-containing protein [Clostridia bacterium]|nr:DUF2142 domain-containing protein [Clostridia bacterium]